MRVCRPGLRSENAWRIARRVAPGGVHSPVRAFGSVGGAPVFLARGKGSRVWDEDGRTYVDYLASWGPLILGHADPQVVRAATEAVRAGATFGAPTTRENLLALEVLGAFPSVRRVRFVSSGTEAAMSALRLARGVTGRDCVVKFEGCYHGHSDGLLSQSGSGLATLGIPSSPGVPAEFARATLTLPFNDAVSVTRLFRQAGKKIAAVIVEPVAGNMGVVPPAPGFLRRLRAVTRKHGSLLIFDEVITGFRVARGGAQALYRIRPDLTVLGKILGGGLPAGAYGGSREIMDHVAPAGSVYQAGTLSGNPVAMAAGLATLRKLRAPLFARLERLGGALQKGLETGARAAGIPARVQRVGSMVTLFFRSGPVRNFSDAAAADGAAFSRFFHGMLRRGIYWPPSPFETAFVSAAHTMTDIRRTVAAAVEVFSAEM